MNRHRYEDDLVLWAEEQTALLRAGETAGLDLENLAEEIESVGSSERHEMRSRLKLIVQHLLKWRFQPELQSRSRRTTIRVQRRDLHERLGTSPSLRRLLPDALVRCYPSAREDAAEESGLLRLPDECPFTLEQVMDLDWLPD